MKLKSTILFLLSTINFVFGQTAEKIKIPNGIVYNYASYKINEKAKKLITESISQKDYYSILDKSLIIGPTLWNRFQNIESLKGIPGNVVFHIDDVKVDGK